MMQTVPSITVRLIFSWTHTLLLFVMFLFHMYRRKFLLGNIAANQRPPACNTSCNGPKATTCCQSVTLCRVAFAMFIVYGIRVSAQSIVLSINLLYPLLNDSTCRYLKYTELVMAISGRTLVHLFVAMRTRLSKSPRSAPSKWYKLGLALLSLDIALIAFSVSPFMQLELRYASQQCVTIAISHVFMAWFLFNDIFIGVYCLFAFILPLRRLLHSVNQENVQDISGLMRKVVICSIVILFITIVGAGITMVYAPLGVFIASISGNITVYCVIMQFNPVPLDKVKSDCLRFAVSVFQLNCAAYVKLKHTNNEKMMQTVVVQSNPQKINTDTKTCRIELDTPATDPNVKSNSTSSMLDPTPTSLPSPMPSGNTQMQCVASLSV